MTTPQFEKVNLAWRLQQLQQNLGEWWELQWRRWFGSLPDVQAPSIEDPEFWARLVANSLIFCLPSYSGVFGDRGDGGYLI
jgi:hypothetical protein